MKPGKDFIGVGVGAFILNEKNELLLVKRAKNSKVEPGTWMIPGGGVDFNEKLEDCVKREIKEEIGVDLEIERNFGVINHILPEECQHWVSAVFKCNIKSGEPEIKEPHKHVEMRWFSLDKLPENLSKATRLTLDVYMKK